MTSQRNNRFVHIAEAAEKVVENAINRLGAKREHGRKETGRDGATNTDPTLTETDLSKEVT